MGIGVVGAGYWGRKLIPEYLALSKTNENVELKYVVDTDRERLGNIAEEFGLARNTLETDISRVLKDPSVLAVHLALPNELHYSVGMEAIESHKHVLLEKPMALTVRDAFKLARKAEEESVVLHIGHIFRFNNAVREARALLSKGAIGRPLYYGVNWEALLSPPEGRDIVFDLGPHPIDVLNFLSGEWPSRVVTLGKSFLRRKKDHEEVAETVAEFEGDIFAHIGLSWLYSGPKRRQISITGDSGTVEVDALNQEIMVYGQGPQKNHPVVANNTILSMITHFVNSILKGEAPQGSGLVGAMTVAVLSAMRESMRSSRFVDVLASK